MVVPVGAAPDLTERAAVIYPAPHGSESFLLRDGDVVDFGRGVDCPIRFAYAPIAHETGTFSLALSPDRRTLAAGGDAHVVQVWDLSSEHRIARLEGHTDTIGALAFSRDGSMLASGSDDRSVELWRTADWTRQVDFIADQKTVRALGFSPDGTRLVTGGGQGVVKIWPTTTITDAQICNAVAAQVTSSELREALDGIRPEACTNLIG
jgi:WD40 repeat protein